MMCRCRHAGVLALPAHRRAFPVPREGLCRALERLAGRALRKRPPWMGVTKARGCVRVPRRHAARPVSLAPPRLQRLRGVRAGRQPGQGRRSRRGRAARAALESCSATLAASAASRRPRPRSALPSIGTGAYLAELSALPPPPPPRRSIRGYA